MSEYQCPNCKSSKIRVQYPDIRCTNCGYGGALIDFPVSWDWHRHFSIYYSGVDPGPNEPRHPRIDEIEERISKLEEEVSKITSEQPRAPGLKHIKEELEQVKMGLRYTQRLYRKPRKSSLRRKIKPIEE